MTGTTRETVARRETGSDIRTALIGVSNEQGSVLGPQRAAVLEGDLPCHG